MSPLCSDECHRGHSHIHYQPRVLSEAAERITQDLKSSGCGSQRPGSVSVQIEGVTPLRTWACARMNHSVKKKKPRPCTSNQPAHEEGLWKCCWIYERLTRLRMTTASHFFTSIFAFLAQFCNIIWLIQLVYSWSHSIRWDLLPLLCVHLHLFVLNHDFSRRKTYFSLLYARSNTQEYVLRYLHKLEIMSPVEFTENTICRVHFTAAFNLMLPEQKAWRWKCLACSTYYIAAVVFCRELWFKSLPTLFVNTVDTVSGCWKQHNSMHFYSQFCFVASF